MIEGVGLSQDNELHVGEGECNGLGLRVDADSDGSVGSRMKFWFSFFCLFEGSMCTGATRPFGNKCRITTNLGFGMWLVRLVHPSSSFIFLPSSDVGFSPRLDIVGHVMRQRIRVDLGLDFGAVQSSWGSKDRVSMMVPRYPQSFRCSINVSPCFRNA